MKMVQFLTRAYGEYNSTPRSIEAPYVGQEFDMITMHPTILSSSDWRPTSKPLYAVEDVSIPEWQDPKDYNSFAWKWYKAIGGNEDLGKSAYEKITAIDNGHYRLAIVKLLNQKSFRSAFRQSLRLQIEDWLHNPKNIFQYPFSEKQFTYVITDHIRIEARQIGVA